MDRQKIERSIKGLSEWQMHVQAESDIDTNISTAIEALKTQHSQEGTTFDPPIATDTNIGDTISRQVAIDRFNVIRPVDPKKDEYTKGIDVGIAMCIVAVKDQPTIQPEPKKGHWIKHIDKFEGGEQYECSECGVLWEFNDGSPEDNEAYFCPKCGAKMKGADT